MLKKLVLFVAAVMLLASSAQAALNKFVVSTTTPAITTGTIGQAGKITFTLEDGTTYGKSNATKIEVPVGVTLAKDYDFFIVGTTNLAAQTSGPLIGTANVSHLVINVRGSKGSRALIMEVVNGSIAVTGNNKASIVLFDGADATDEAKGALWVGEWDDAAGAFKAGFKNATAADNTLCIEVGDTYKEKYVSVALTTVASYDYHPSTPNVAELKPKTISPVELKGDRTYMLGSGQGAGCQVNYESFAEFCEKGWGTNRRGYVAVQNSELFPEGTYTVTAEVLVNGAAGSKGAYFSQAVQEIQFIDTRSNVSDSTYTTDVLPTTTAPQYFADGVKTMKLPTNCMPEKDAKVTKVVSQTVANAVTAAHADKDFLRVDVPNIVLVKDDLPANAKIGVKITVAKGCAVIFEESYENLFTVVEKCAPKGDEPAAGTLFFPYFADAPYWNGMALTNTSDKAVNATLTIVSVDGKDGQTSGEGTIEVVVPAKGMYVKTVDKIIEDSAFNGTTKAADRCYIKVVPASGSLTGFAMMGNAGESMGYTVNN